MSFLDDLRAHLNATEQRPLTPEVICEILAKRWGGERVYIPKCTGREELKRDATPSSLIAQGVSKSTAYRAIRRNWVGKW